MIVGDEESKSLLHDISRLPRLVFEFIAFIPNEIADMLRQRSYVPALLGIVGFGMFSEVMVAALTNRFWWTFGKGRALPLLQFWGVDGIILLILTIILSLMVRNPSQPQIEPAGN